MSKNTELKKIRQIGYLTLALILPVLNFNRVSAEERPTIFSNEEGTLTRNLSWGAPKLPYNKVADIKDELTHKVLGKVVPDRHGIGSSNIYSPFYSPEYGDLVYVSFWESRNDGCFIEMLIQNSHRDGVNLANSMAVKSLEIGIGETPITLLRENNSVIEFQPQVYSYTNNQGFTQTGLWYMTRTRFRLNANNAMTLSNAPVKEVSLRLKLLSNNQTTIIPIGSGTVNKWKEVYSFNPKCMGISPKKPVH